MRSVGGWWWILRIISEWFMTKYAAIYVKSVMQLFLSTTKQSNMPCPECVKKCRIETLVKHIKTVHKKIHNIKCRQCGQGFHTKKQIEKHVRVKHQGTFLQCRATAKETGGECGKYFILKKVCSVMFSASTLMDMLCA